MKKTLWSKTVTDGIPKGPFCSKTVINRMPRGPLQVKNFHFKQKPKGPSSSKTLTGGVLFQNRDSQREKKAFLVQNRD